MTPDSKPIPQADPTYTVEESNALYEEGKLPGLKSPQAGTQTPKTDANLSKRLRALAVSLEPIDGAEPTYRPDKLCCAAADQLARLETERNELRQQLAKSKDDSDDLAELCSRYSADIETLRGKLAAATQEAEQAKRERDGLEQERITLKLSVEQLRKQWDEEHYKLNRAETQLTEAQSQLKEMACVSDDHRKRIADLLFDLGLAQAREKKLRCALEAAEPLAIAWVAHYTRSEAYGCGHEQPLHREILNEIRAALANATPSGAEPTSNEIR